MVIDRKDNNAEVKLLDKNDTMPSAQNKGEFCVCNSVNKVSSGPTTCDMIYCASYG